MNEVVVRMEFPAAGKLRQPAPVPADGPGQVIAASGRFRRTRRLWRRGSAIIGFVVLFPLLLFGPLSSLRIVDSLAGSRSVIARQRLP